MIHKQVYQKLPAPITLDKNIYSEPYSAQNTSGNLKAAYALFELLDPVTKYHNLFLQSTASFSQTYKNIISRINHNNVNAELYNKANCLIYSDEVYAPSPLAHDFYLIETQPYNLFDESGSYITFTAGPAESDAEFISINSSEIRTIKFYGFLAHIKRPWYIEELFLQQEWCVIGCSAGAYSTGTLPNNGMLPLIPATMLISIDEYGKRQLQAVISNILPLFPAHNEILFPQADSIHWSFAKAQVPTSQNTSVLYDKFGNIVQL